MYCLLPVESLGVNRWLFSGKSRVVMSRRLLYVELNRMAAWVAYCAKVELVLAVRANVVVKFDCVSLA